ncbi:MAG: hypothetical protein QNK37_24420 [Acidobacteriota bacterium]|nr:hypothetical protein [Acidobacteriota bacterium]
MIYKGYPKRKIRINMCPKGKQSGEQYVRNWFPKEVNTLRSKNYMNIVLVTVIDADAHLVADRFKQLLDSLTEPRGVKEPIVLSIPKRNIETWIHYLMGKVVNEEDIYPKLERESVCKPYVERLAKAESWPEDAPLSLKVFREELGRLR